MPEHDEQGQIVGDLEDSADEQRRAEAGEAEQVAAVPGIVGESDDVYFDSARKRIYVIGGQGYVSVVQQMSPDRYGLIANVPTKVGARTGYWNEQHDRLYVGVQAEGAAPAQILGFEAEDY